jgi:hypothetical protein
MSGFCFATEPLDPNFIYGHINAGWNGSLAKLGKSLNPERNYIVLNFVEPTVPMDLRSAELFRRSFFVEGLSQGLSKPELGHSLIAWQCRDSLGSMHRGATGFTGESSGQTLKMLKTGWGLTPLASTFTDGFLQTPDLVADSMERAKKAGRHIWSVALEIDDEHCGRLYSFLYNFVYHPNRPMDYFGLTVDPEKMQGGGCGSFAYAIAHALELFPSEMFQNLRRTLKAPSVLFGFGLKAPEDTKPFRSKLELNGQTQNHVSMLRLLDGPWSGPGPQESIELIDPEMFIFAVRTLQNLYFESKTTPLAVQKAYDSHYPRSRSIRSRHAAIEPGAAINPPRLSDDSLWIVDKIALNADFDDQTKAIDRSLREWWRMRLQNQMTPEMVFGDRQAFLLLRSANP